MASGNYTESNPSSIEPFDGGDAPAPASSPQSISEQPSFSLERLRALIVLRDAARADDGPEGAMHRRLVDRAIYSVYRDCITAGASAEARSLIDTRMLPNGGESEPLPPSS